MSWGWWVLGAVGYFAVPVALTWVITRLDLWLIVTLGDKYTERESWLSGAWLVWPLWVVRFVTVAAVLGPLLLVALTLDRLIDLWKAQGKQVHNPLRVVLRHAEQARRGQEES